MISIFIACIDSPQGIDYIGTLAVTKSGYSCQRWALDTPHKRTSDINWEDASIFPEYSIEAAGNKCRNPDKGEAPWCYTKDPGKRWEHCDVPMCDGSDDILGIIFSFQTKICLHEDFPLLKIDTENYTNIKII